MAMEAAPNCIPNGYIALLLSICVVVLTTFSHSAMAQCSAAESAALLQLKSVLLDARGELASWSPAVSNCCSWTGVKCSSTGVEAIDLTNVNAPVDAINNAASTAAGIDALAALPELASLRTDGALWNGPVPHLSKVPLRELVISNPQSGRLPSDIASMGGTLERLVVTGASFSTGLSSDLCKLTKLKVLEVSSTGIPSLGPSCLGALTSLEEVRMQANRKVAGGLPVWPTALPNLKVLDFSNNAHTGNIPVQYGKLGRPGVELRLGGNHLSSRIPAGLGNTPISAFRPGNEKLCGVPLPACPAY